MASLARLKKALADTIEGHVTSEELNVFTYIPDLIQTPAVCIDVHMSKFDGAMARGDDMWRFNVYIVVQRGDAENSQDNLDDFLESAGPRSIREAIFKNPNLGLDEDEYGTVQAFVSGVHEYGGGYRDARIDVVGAILRVDVHTDGSIL
jgi:hypothetical protein